MDQPVNLGIAPWDFHFIMKLYTEWKHYATEEE